MASKKTLERMFVCKWLRKCNNLKKCSGKISNVSIKKLKQEAKSVYDVAPLKEKACVGRALLVLALRMHRTICAKTRARSYATEAIVYIFDFLDSFYLINTDYPKLREQLRAGQEKVCAIQHMSFLQLTGRAPRSPDFHPLPEFEEDCIFFPPNYNQLEIISV